MLSSERGRPNLSTGARRRTDTPRPTGCVPHPHVSTDAGTACCTCYRPPADGVGTRTQKQVAYILCAAGTAAETLPNKQAQKCLLAAGGRIAGRHTAWCWYTRYRSGKSLNIYKLQTPEGGLPRRRKPVQALSKLLASHPLLLFSLIPQDGCHCTTVPRHTPEPPHTVKGTDKAVLTA